ncbi:MAG TPA: glutamine--fructose-6-phosphate transaminase (isomerizing), partial [bacterium]|nr:glutamine--fructose-6-phosphate transaminase (isomerizing) [bacterium]
AHTRWATHGGVTRANAHPHTSADGRFAIVHNGIIANHEALRQELAARGVQFASQTDTEVVAHLLSQAYGEFGDVEAAFLAVVRRLRGMSSFAMITSLEPERIYGVRMGTPLVLGLAEHCNFLASDINAFLPFTRDALVLEDGEYAVLTPQAVHLKRIADGRPLERRPLRIEWDAETSRKGGYSHYMLKEIFDQPQTVINALSTPQAGVERLAESIQRSRMTYLMGVGTTHYVALVAQYLFSRLAGRFVAAVSSDEFRDLAVIGPEDLLVSISQSGETYDTRRGVDFAKAQGARTASIVNVMGSSLSLASEQVILQGSGPEICVVSTKAALAQMIILQRTALCLGLKTGKIGQPAYQAQLQALQDLPGVLQAVLNEQSGFVRNLAEGTVRYHNWLVLGRGVYHAIAQEAALKMKEVTYLHVEGMPAGFLKHGTLAMVDESLASLFLVPPPEEQDLHEQTLTAIQQVKARGGPAIGFAFEQDGQSQRLLDEVIRLPEVAPAVAPYVHLVVAQLLSYFMALKLGRSIDKPRNLAKSVTVA